MPRTVPTSVATSEISRLATSDERSPGSERNASYHRRLKPEKTCSEFCALDENSATTRIGANSQR